MTSMTDILQQQAEHAAALLELLNAENAALKNRDANGLIDIAAQKSQHTLALDQLATTQNNLLEGAHCELNAQGLERYIEQSSHAQRSTLRQAAATVSETLRLCRKQNSINGNIIAANTRFVDTAINILRSTTTETQSIYNGQGREISGNQLKPIAKA